MNTRRSNLIKFLLLDILLIIASLYCVIDNSSNEIGGSDPIALFFGWFGVIFFGGGGIYYLYKNIIYKSAGRKFVELKDEGLMNRDDMIPWNTIEKFIPYQHFIIVVTNDINDRLMNAKGLKWLSLTLNLKLYGGLFAVGNYDYDGTCEEFIDRCFVMINKHTSNTNI